MASKLHAVGPNDPNPPRRRLSITEAAEDGTERELLMALRERVAATVENPDCPPRDLAALSRRLTEITKEIAAIDARDQEAAAHAEVDDGRFNAKAV